MTTAAQTRVKLGLTNEAHFVVRTSRYAVMLFTTRDSELPSPRYRMKGLSGCPRDHSWNSSGSQDTFKKLGVWPKTDNLVVYDRMCLSALASFSRNLRARLLRAWTPVHRALLKQPSSFRLARSTGETHLGSRDMPQRRKPKRPHKHPEDGLCDEEQGQCEDKE